MTENAAYGAGLALALLALTAALEVVARLITLL